MTDEKQDTKPTGFAARMKTLLGGCGGGCCCGDVRIVSKEPEQENEREDR